MVTIKDKVRTFIVDNFLFGDKSFQLADTDSLIENDIIDSTAVLELVAFIEDDFGIAMVDSDVVP
ncbi:MAG: acyl carrier protein, partial [Mesorhizobium sp.]